MANEFELAEAYTEFTVRDAKFIKGLASVQASLERTKARMQAVSRAAKVMLVAGAGALVLFVKAAADAEEVMGKFNAVFKDQAAATAAWATKFSDDVGRSKFAVMGFMATLQDTFVPLGFARTEATEMSKTLTTLAVDLASFNPEVEDAGQAIALLTSGLVGNHEALRSFGVVITQVSLNQELLNMGIAGGVKAATEQEKVLARMNIVLAGTADAQGDAINTAGQLKNQLRDLKKAYDEMSVEIGKELIPVTKDLVVWLKSNMAAVKGVIMWTVDVIKTYGEFALKTFAAITAVRTYLKVLAAVRDAIRLTAIGQSILNAISGPAGWAKLILGAGVAAGAVMAVSAAFDSVAESAEVAAQASADANKEAAKASAHAIAPQGAGGLDRGSQIIARRARAAIERGDLSGGGSSAKDEIAGLIRRFEDIDARSKASGLKVDASLADEAKATNQLINDLVKELQDAEAKASAERQANRERVLADEERNRKIVKPLQAARLSGGSMDASQLQSTLQRNIMQNEQNKLKWIKDTATTLAEMQEAGIKITNIEDFEPRWE